MMVEAAVAVVTESGLSFSSAFVGTLAAWYLICPNRRCCQTTKIQEVIGDGR